MNPDAFTPPIGDTVSGVVSDAHHPLRIVSVLHAPYMAHVLVSGSALLSASGVDELIALLSRAKAGLR